MHFLCFRVLLDMLFPQELIGEDPGMARMAILNVDATMPIKIPGPTKYYTKSSITFPIMFIKPFTKSSFFDTNSSSYHSIQLHLHYDQLQVNQRNQWQKNDLYMGIYHLDIVNISGWLCVHLVAVK